MSADTLEGAATTPLGARVRAARDARGLSRNQLSAYSGVSREAIRNIEEGISRQPGQETLAKLAPYLRESLSDLLALAGYRVNAAPGKPAQSLPPDWLIDEIEQLRADFGDGAYAAVAAAIRAQRESFEALAASRSQRREGGAG
jgi:transcriptional regulator with XRE-family HTH domain